MHLVEHTSIPQYTSMHTYLCAVCIRTYIPLNTHGVVRGM